MVPAVATQPALLLPVECGDCALQGRRAKLHKPRIQLPILGAISSVGRAPRLHRGCRRFEPVIAHHFPFILSCRIRL